MERVLAREERSVEIDRLCVCARVEWKRLGEKWTRRIDRQECVQL